jgi:hypothetical protein
MSHHSHPQLPSGTAWEGIPAPMLLGPVEQPGFIEPCFLGVELQAEDMAPLLAGLARLVGPGREIYCADACNRFDPYRFSDWARRSGQDPTDVLSRVFVSRAFTIHQMAALARELVPTLAARRPRPLVVVLGTESLFLDEQIPLFERQHHFRLTMASLVELRAAGVSLVATMTPESSRTPGEPTRRPWSRLLARAVDRLVTVRRLPDGEGLRFEDRSALRATILKTKAERLKG